MRPRAGGKGAQVIAALKRRDNAPVAELVGELHQFLRRPAIIIFRKSQIGERIGMMGIETRRNEDEIGRKLRQSGKDHIGENFTKLRRTRAWGKAGVENIAHAALSRTARARIKRPLMGRGVKEIGIGLEAGLRAVAVMDIEVDGGNAAKAMRGARGKRAQGDIVEEEKPNRQ